MIIPTRDRPSLLADCLRALRQQTASPADHVIVVVDNSSNRESESVVVDAARSAINIEYVREPLPGLHMARHRGADATEAELLLFGDDDMRAAPTWIESVGQAFDDATVGVVGGPCRPDLEEPPPPWVSTLWIDVEDGRILPEWSVAELTRGAGPIDPNLVWGCNFGVRRTTLIEVGGFHPDGFTEEHGRWRGDGETHVARGAAAGGWDVRFEPGASVDHVVSSNRLTFDYLRVRGFRGGLSTSFHNFRATGATDSLLTRGTARMLRLATQSNRVGGPRELANRHFARGYLWHQQRLRRDRALRAWALQESYWGTPGVIPPLRANAAVEGGAW